MSDERLHSSANTQKGKAGMSVQVIDKSTALANLDCILQAAVSPALARRHRLALGAAASWLQSLIDCGLLPDTPRPGQGDLAKVEAGPAAAAAARAVSEESQGSGGRWS